jgi:hypothetical protein
VKELLDTLLKYFRSRTPRERWGSVLAACVLGTLLVNAWVISPLSSRTEEFESRISDIEDGVFQSTVSAAEIRSLQQGIAEVEAQIKPDEATNLFALLESLAAQSNVKDQLESIKPKTPSDNERYPETRVAVQLRGATLAQAVEFIYQIENAPMHLIVKTITLKARGDESKLLDVSFTVSSFKRA